ncbi:hypothetical protein [Pseudomonas protegens]|uniref:hypothetical protein n=1 Tax=Pseudomonas protegens TaxID=380021 RepID=UPI00276EAE76|nr:hypothetical protein [Pseudomonas protegens]MDP9514636.1 hypothetical protein [Pseudomonas protegens]
MSIKIKNKRHTEVEVAVNYWHTDGKPGDVSDTYYVLKPNTDGEWKREDARGYLMDIKNIGVYYIAYDSEITIEDNAVKSNDKPITKLSF